MAQNNIALFNFNGSDVRVIDKEDNAWFVLIDVCKILELENPRNATVRLDDDEKDAVHIMDAIGRSQETTIINESGLYSLILRSRKPEAKRFKKWVTAEILPSIRKTGSYLANNSIALELAQLRQEISALRSNNSIEGNVSNYKPLIDVMKELEVPQTGRREFVQQCSKRLNDQLNQYGQGHLVIDRHIAGRHLFHVTAINNWLKRGGYDLIKAHINALRVPTQITLTFFLTGIKI